MTIRDDAKAISLTYQSLKGCLDTNAQLLDIFEGNLLGYILADLKQSLSPKAFFNCKDRVPAINIEKRVIDKLSTIYTQHPERSVSGTESDNETWEWYIEQMQLDVHMQVANEYFNMHRATALEPCLDEAMRPNVRVLPRDRFFTYSNNLIDPLKMTHFIKVMGIMPISKLNSKGEAYTESKVVLYVYTDEQFLAIDEDGEPVDDIMMRLYAAGAIGENGRNLIGKIPFVYINKSRNLLNPKADEDMLSMTKLIPTLFTDVNYAIKFQAFSIYYTIDVEQANFELNPNVFLDLKSDKTSGTDPKVGSIKPDLDSDKAMSAAKEQLSLWLQSRNIRPGSTGELTSENFASGISKIVDEMDTTNERKKTVPYFANAEQQLFDLIKNHLHPVWVTNPEFEIKTGFTSDAELTVAFSEQIVNKPRAETLSETKDEMSIGLLSRETGMRRLNPEWSEEDLVEETKRIEADRTVEIEEDIPAENPDKLDDTEVEDGDEAPEV